MHPQLRNALGVMTLVLIAVAAYSVVRYTQSYDFYARAFDKSIQPSSFRSFPVSDDEKEVVVPDVAQFSFSVITEGGNDLTALMQQNTEKVNKGLAFVKSQGVDEKDIQTQDYNVSPRYTYPNCTNEKICPPPSISGYTISQSIAVKVRDFSKTGPLLSGVVTNGANSVSQLSFVLDDRSVAEGKAREKAIAKAKEKAAGIAKAGGFKVGRILSIEEGTSAPSPYPLATPSYALGSAKDSAQMASPEVQPGSQEVHVSITIRFEIED